MSEYCRLYCAITEKEIPIYRGQTQNVNSQCHISLSLYMPMLQMSESAFLSLLFALKK